MTCARWPTWILGAWLLIHSPSALPAAEGHALRAERKPGDVARVEVLLEVGGDLKLVDEGKVKPLAMSVVGKLRYHERLLAAPSAAGDGARSLRHYERALATIKIEKETISPKLRDERRPVVAACERLAEAARHAACGHASLQLLERQRCAGGVELAPLAREDVVEDHRVTRG